MLPGRFAPGKEIRDPLYRRTGEPQNRSGFVRKISPSPGFDPPTVEPVASRYTADAVPATYETNYHRVCIQRRSSNRKNALYICSLERGCDSVWRLEMDRACLLGCRRPVRSGKFKQLYDAFYVPEYNCVLIQLLLSTGPCHPFSMYCFHPLYTKLHLGNNNVYF